jgi:hypothetical protein
MVQVGCGDVCFEGEGAGGCRGGLSINFQEFGGREGNEVEKDEFEAVWLGGMCLLLEVRTSFEYTACHFKSS